MKTEEHERAAELIAMLLRDPAARASFRRNPADVCRAHGLEDVAAELAGRDGALQSLDVRESRSSVAGVLIAAAAEGAAFFAFMDDAHAEGGLSPDVARVVALTRPHMPAVIPDGSGGSGSGGGGAADVVAQADAPAAGATPDQVAMPAAAPDPLPADAAGQGAATPEPAVVEAAAAPVAPPPPDLLHDQRLTLSDSAAQGLAEIGPSSRTSEILTSLVARHTLELGTVNPDGSFIITMVDGAPVGPANIAARDLAQELAALDPRIKPTAIGTPWSLTDGKPGEANVNPFYTGDEHQHHILIGYGEPPPKPAPVIAAPAAPDPAPAPAVVSTPAVTPDPVATPALATGSAQQVAAASGAPGATGAFAAVGQQGGAGTLSVAAVGSRGGSGSPEPAGDNAGLVKAAVLDLPPGVDATPAGPKAMAALAEARKYLGTPYLWGGSKPSTGFDCSGLMQWAYHEAGISIGRVTTQQIHDGVAVDRAHLRAGDMVFFQDSKGYVHHVGMYIGNDKFLHAPHTGDVVKISSLNDSYYAHQFAGGRRVDTGAPVDAPAGLQLAGVEDAPARGAAPVRASAATGGFAALPDHRKGAGPRSTVQVMKAVDSASARKPGAGQPELVTPTAWSPRAPAAIRATTPSPGSTPPGWQLPRPRPASRRNCRSWPR